MRARRRAWSAVAAGGKTVLPRAVREPIERKLGERNERRIPAIDLDFARVIREAPEAALRDEAELRRLLAAVGLNNELQVEIPPELSANAGYGLLLWQYPNQFAPYLLEAARHGVRRYLEVGVRHGEAS